MRRWICSYGIELEAGMEVLQKFVRWSLFFCLLFEIPLFAETATSDAQKKPSGEEMDLELEELFNVKISVASKKEESIPDAPGVIYVVSQDELKRIGAITLKEVLMRVPSIGIANTSLTNRSLPVMRGDLIKPNSSHILFLLNGRPVREVQAADR